MAKRMTKRQKMIVVGRLKPSQRYLYYELVFQGMSHNEAMKKCK